MRSTVGVWLSAGLVLAAQGCSAHNKAAVEGMNESSGAGSGGMGTQGDVNVGVGAACGAAIPPEEEGWPTALHWCSSGPLVSPIANERHPILSVKDPSVVYYGDRWHIFATTADESGQWSMVYTSFADWKDAPNASQFYLNENPALVGYHCAPQVFFFAPHNKWYLIFQSGQPQYSTNDDISRPEDWTRPTNFFAAEPESVKAHKGSGGWLDFWIICDDARCHLFFTDDNGTLYRSQTTLEEFPKGFEEPVIAIQGTKESLFEGSSTYYVEETKSYLTLVEAFGPAGRRFYRSYVSDTLDGEWKPWLGSWENPFAGMNNVSYADGVAWSDQVSHGELIRNGYDQKLSISLRDLRFLYQGMDPNGKNPDYFRLPYRLSLLTRTALP